MYWITYTTDNNQISVRDEYGQDIPFDPANSDYQRYLAWLDEGNTPEPWEPSTTPEP